MRSLSKKPLIASIISLFAGVLLTLSLAPYHQPLLAFISAALLLAAWSECTPRTAALRGFLFGFASFGTGVYWVYIAIHQYGHAEPIFALLLTVLFISVLSVFPMMQGYVLNRFFKKPTAIKFFIAFPLSWVMIDLLRGWFLTGFPWLYIGYSQLDTVFKSFAPYGSVFLLTFICAFSGATLLSPFYLKRYQWVIAGLFFACLFSCAFGLSLKKIALIDTVPIKISIVQGNIPQEEKWDAEKIIQTIEKYQRLTEPLWHSELIIWPEAAMPIFQTSAKFIIDELNQIAKKHQASLIFGVPLKENNQYFNGLLMVGQHQGTYKKHHLVPFGEYTPFEPLSTWVMNKLAIPMSDASPGPKDQPLLEVKGVKIAPFICYEIIFPFLVRQNASDANLLLVISDDSWYGESIAKYQHLQIAQMRALETQRFIIFSTNTGVTAIIKPDGTLQNKLQEDTEGSLSGTIYGLGGHTFWMKKHFTF